MLTERPDLGAVELRFDWGGGASIGTYIRHVDLDEAPEPDVLIARQMRRLTGLVRREIANDERREAAISRLHRPRVFGR